MDQIDTYLSFLILSGASLSEPLGTDPLRAVDQLLNRFAQGRIIQTLRKYPGQWQPEDSLKIGKGKRLVLDYYKNNSIIHFIPAAYTALSILARDELSFSTREIVPDYLFLSDLFSVEFLQNDEQQPEFGLRKALKTFIDIGFLIPHPTLPETFSLSSTGYRKLKQFAAFLMPFVESYRMVLRGYGELTQDSGHPRSLVKKIMGLGRQMYVNRKIDRVEAISRVNIENALSYFTKKGIKTTKKQGIGSIL